MAQPDRRIFSLQGHTALITGASSGLGAHFAQVLTAAGSNVILTARRGELIRQHADRLNNTGAKAYALTMDVTSGASVADGFAKAEAVAGPIDIIVNNAGIVTQAPALTVSDEDWQAVIDTNLTGAFRVAQTAARRLQALKLGGSIINIASILGLGVAKQVAAYTAAKAGLIQITHSLALEWAPYGIRVNALAPGYIDTELNHDFLRSPAGAALVQRIPQRRAGTPEDLDGALLLLASSAGAYMTGSVIVVDGGHLVSSL